MREEVHRLLPDAKVTLHGSRVRQCNLTLDSDRNFLIIADYPLDRKIITKLKLKDGLYDIELENDEVVSNIIRSRQEWSSPEYDALSFKKAGGGRIVDYKEEIARYWLECAEETY